MALLSAHLTRDLREPSAVIQGPGISTPPSALEFTPDLSAAEAATLAQIFAAAAKGVDLTPTEYQAIKDEVSTLSAYLGAASPTAAQTVTALKSLIRVVRALVRE